MKDNENYGGQKGLLKQDKYCYVCITDGHKWRYEADKKKRICGMCGWSEYKDPINGKWKTI